MKINCEYCGAAIDTDIHSTCPNCGGSYQHNADLIKYKHQEEEDREDRKRLEQLRETERIKDKEYERQYKLKEQEYRNKNYRRESNRKVLKTGAILIVIVIIVAIIGFIVMGLGILKQIVNSPNFNSASNNSSAVTTIEDDIKSSTMSINNSEVIDLVENPVEVGFNEVGETSKYSFMCDKIEETEVRYFDPPEGYMNVMFHLIIGNNTNKRMDRHDSVDGFENLGIICEVNDISMKSNDYKKGVEGPALVIPANSKVEGYLIYKCPIDAEEFVIKMGLISLRIPNTLR